MLFLSGDTKTNPGKRGGVCTYCKNCLPLNVLNIKFPHEHIAFDLQSGDLLYCFSSVYR